MNLRFLPALTAVALLATVDLGAQQAVTYAKDVAPIIQQKCQECHQPGAIAPMSLLTYEEAKAFAPLIRHKVSTRQMPPFPVDRTVGIQEFQNDISLSDEQIATIVNWVDSGAPLGDPADLPPSVEWPDYYTNWQFEEYFGRPPDIIIENPPYVVRASGEDQWPELRGPVIPELTEERWMQAIEARPKNPETRYVFHHGGPSLQQDGGGTGLMNSPAGKTGEILPKDAGKLFKPGARVNYSMHFFPIGRDIEAVVQWGIWFYPKGQEPRFETPGEEQFRADMSTGAGSFNDGMGESKVIARRSDLLIPPHGQAMLQGTYVLDKPARIHSIRGHMHVRGKYQVVQVVYPDGRRETLNKLDWDHLWHTTFIYKEHVQPLLPKGSVLITTSVFDNTENNPHNPDPSQWVTAGSRTVDDMSHIWIGITYFDDEEYFNQLVEERKQLLAKMAQEAVATASTSN
jgi:mono/diheme cytochrome c family protein